MSRTRVYRYGRYCTGSGAPLTTSFDRAVDFGPSLCSFDQLTAHVAFPFSRYRGAANGCNIGCCSCYDPVHHPGVCCVDAFATQFPQVPNRTEVCFCGEIYDFAPVLSEKVGKKRLYAAGKSCGPHHAYFCLLVVTGITVHAQLLTHSQPMSITPCRARVWRRRGTRPLCLRWG